MNIGVDIRCLMDKNRTGVGEYTYGLLNAVFSLDQENQYYLFYNSNKDVVNNLPKWNLENVHYVALKWPNKLLNLLLFFRVLKLDTLVSQKSILPTGRQEVKSQKFLKIDIWFSPNLNFTNLSKSVKHILTIHDLSFKFLPECFTIKKRMWHMCLNPSKQCKRAEVILTPSENTKRDVISSYQIADNRIQVLRPGLLLGVGHKIEDVRKKFNLPDKYILFLGTLEPRKNVESIIEAYCFSELRTREYELVLAGAPGWKNKKLLKLIGETSGVKYLGFVPDEDKPALYQNASLFVFPSLYEGFGIPVLEACNYGVPVITSNRSSLPEVVGDTAYLVNPHNVDEIVEGMKLLLQNEELRTQVIKRQLERVKEFNWQKGAKDFLEIFSKNG